MAGVMKIDSVLAGGCDRRTYAQCFEGWGSPRQHVAACPLVRWHSIASERNAVWYGER